jgi:hypothetical protein
MLPETLQAAAGSIPISDPSHVYLSAPLIGLIIANVAQISLGVVGYFSRKKRVAASLKHTHAATEILGLDCSGIAKSIAKVEDLDPRVRILEANYMTLLKSNEDGRKENREDHQLIFKLLREREGSDGE